MKKRLKLAVAGAILVFALGLCNGNTQNQQKQQSFFHSSTISTAFHLPMEYMADISHLWAGGH
jgi:hypothetical protein